MALPPRPRRWIRRAALAAAVALCSCGSPVVAPELEAGGEPGPSIYSATAAFQSVGYPTTGTATYTLDDAGRAALELGATFSVPDVPGTAVYLTNTGRIEDAVRVGALRSTRGAQRWTFVVPRGAAWRWVVLWSDGLRVEIARARIET